MTPETDKAERMAFANEYMVPTEVARRLERERDEAREALRELLTRAEPHLRFLDPPTRNSWRAAAGLEARK